MTEKTDGIGIDIFLLGLGEESNTLPLHELQRRQAVDKDTRGHLYKNVVKLMHDSKYFFAGCQVIIMEAFASSITAYHLDVYNISFKQGQLLTACDSMVASSYR